MCKRTEESFLFNALLLPTYNIVNYFKQKRQAVFNNVTA